MAALSCVSASKSSTAQVLEYAWTIWGHPAYIPDYQTGLKSSVDSLEFEDCCAYSKLDYMPGYGIIQGSRLRQGRVSGRVSGRVPARAPIRVPNRASPDLQNRLGGTALMLASFNGHFDVVTELLKAGADVNAKSKNKHTALMQATVNRNETAVQIINLLLDQKADINAQDQEGYTALMRAIDCPPPPPPLPPSFKRTKTQKVNERLRRQAEILLMIVKALVMRGADLSLRDQRGRTALEIARVNRQTRISEFLKSR